MTHCLADQALRLAGLTTRAFGWTPNQFWQATPAELAAILTAGDDAVPQPLNRHDFDILLERDTHD